MKKTFLILAICFGSMLITTSTTANKRDSKNQTMLPKSIAKVEAEKRIKEYLWIRNYEEALEFIKSHEGFNEGKEYICPGGERTIGYGHVISDKDPDFGGQITKAQAENLLRKDFARLMKTAKSYTNLEGSKLIAVTHFIYAKGIGRFLRSNLRNCIINNDSLMIEKEFKKWVYYTDPKTGKKIRSKVAENVCNWEANMFYSDSNIKYF